MIADAVDLLTSPMTRVLALWVVIACALVWAWLTSIEPPRYP